MIKVDESITLGKRIYRKLFSHNRFFEFNKYLFECSLHGMGCLNYENFVVSGEQYFVKNVLGTIYSKNKHRIVFDIGAFQGEYSKMLADIIPSARIYSFEPNPHSYQIAKETLAAYKNVQLINTAISDTAGEGILYDLKQNEGSCYASLHKDVVEDSASGAVSAFSTKLDTVDNLMNELGIDSLDLLKIDVEGNELQVMEGARQAILDNRISVVHFEFNEMNIPRGVFLKDMKKLLSSYRLFRLLPSSMLLVPEWPCLAEIFVFQNIVAIRRDLF